MPMKKFRIATFHCQNVLICAVHQFCYHQSVEIIQPHMIDFFWVPQFLLFRLCFFADLICDWIEPKNLSEERHQALYCRLLQALYNICEHSRDIDKTIGPKALSLPEAKMEDILNGKQKHLQPPSSFTI